MCRRGGTDLAKERPWNTDLVDMSWNLEPNILQYFFWIVRGTRKHALSQIREEAAPHSIETTSSSSVVVAGVSERCSVSNVVLWRFSWGSSVSCPERLFKRTPSRNCFRWLESSSTLPWNRAGSTLFGRSPGVHSSLTVPFLSTMRSRVSGTKGSSWLSACARGFGS